MSELTGSNQRCRAQFKCAQTVVGQRLLEMDPTVCPTTTTTTTNLLLIYSIHNVYFTQIDIFKYLLSSTTYSIRILKV